MIISTGVAWVWQYQNACTFPDGPVVAGGPQSIADRDRKKPKCLFTLGWCRLSRVDGGGLDAHCR